MHRHAQQISSAFDRGLAVLRAACVLALLTVTGCATEWITVRSVPKNPLTERLQLGSWSGPKITDRTALILRRYGLDAEQQPEELLSSLGNVIQQDDSAEITCAVAEIAFLAGQNVGSRRTDQALNYYCLAASASFRYLFDPRLADQRNPYDPLYRGASELYNGSVDAVLRLLNEQGMLNPATVGDDQASSSNVRIVARDGPWPAEAYERFELTADFEVGGVTNEYRTYGLGVPLVAVARPNSASGASSQFYPSGLAVPLTAFMRPNTWNDWRRNQSDARQSVVLELHNPLHSTAIHVGPIRIPMEADLTTPLAYFLNEAELEPFATQGLLRPSRDKHKLYFAQPFEPDKIPVVFIHGLWSDPTSWAEMLNELRASPEIRARYQFWFYMYPTGQPFWYSAAELRKMLADVHSEFDPEHRLATMDQTVLIGHSMGGLVAKMQVVESGDSFWNAISEKPIETLDSQQTLKNQLASTFFFRPNRGVRQVITIGSPHRGSSYANATTKWLASKFVRLPVDLVESVQGLAGLQPNVFRSGFSPDYDTSIDSLSADSPILPVLLNAPIPSTTRLHNIIGRKSPTADGDGIVGLQSAALDNAASQLVVEAGHVGLHRHPQSILEVRRILLTHLQEMDRWTNRPTRAYDHGIRPALTWRTEGPQLPQRSR